MASLNKHARSPHSPSPIYGIRPGFTIGDIEGRYMRPLRIYGTWGSPTYPVSGAQSYPMTWDTLTASATSSDSSGTVITPNARVVKVTLNVTAGTGTVQVTIKSAADTYTAVIADFGALGLGTYQFFVGGWSSVDSDNTSYTATQYGPVGAQSEAATGLSPDTDNNHVGGTYNPFQFLSLDGYALKFFSSVVGTVSYDCSAEAVS